MEYTSYVLITAARNEETFIASTIESVAAQTLLPRAWVIVSDASTDRTDDIVRGLAERHDFIRFVRTEKHVGRSFAAKVFALREGLKRLDGMSYSFIGNLDSDITLSPNYYGTVLARMRRDAELGIAGGIILDRLGRNYAPQVSDHNWSVSGAIQVFRRECFEQIGGYYPLECGGVDALAEVLARRAGWRVRAFPDLAAYHHRRTGTQGASVVRARFRQGIMEFCHGYHPLFEAARCLLRFRERPRVVGSIFRFSGYVWANLRRKRSDVPQYAVRYLRSEQWRRLVRAGRLR